MGGFPRAAASVSDFEADLIIAMPDPEPCRRGNFGLRNVLLPQ
jgi:hypothetical protein